MTRLQKNPDPHAKRVALRLAAAPLSPRCVEHTIRKRPRKRAALHPPPVLPPSPARKGFERFGWITWREQAPCPAEWGDGVVVLGDGTAGMRYSLPCRGKRHECPVFLALSGKVTGCLTHISSESGQTTGEQAHVSKKIRQSP